MSLVVLNTAMFTFHDRECLALMAVRADCIVDIQAVFGRRMPVLLSEVEVKITQ